MKISSFEVITHRIRLFRSFAGKFQLVLSLLLLIFAATPASAGITFDGSSSSGVARNTRSISWSHAIGSGLDRALVVAVSTDDFILFKSGIATVTFNGVSMHAAPNSHAGVLGITCIGDADILLDRL